MTFSSPLSFFLLKDKPWVFLASFLNHFPLLHVQSPFAAFLGPLMSMDEAAGCRLLQGSLVCSLSIKLPFLTWQQSLGKNYLLRSSPPSPVGPQPPQCMV